MTAERRITRAAIVAAVVAEIERRADAGAPSPTLSDLADIAGCGRTALARALDPTPHPLLIYRAHPSAHRRWGIIRAGVVCWLPARPGHRAGVAPPRRETPPVATRPCLRCGRPRPDEGPGQRLCAQCRARNQGIAPAGGRYLPPD